MNRQSEDLKSTHMDARPLIPDRDPKRDTEGNECALSLGFIPRKIHINPETTNSTQHRTPADVLLFCLEKQRLDGSAAQALHTSPLCDTANTKLN